METKLPKIARQEIINQERSNMDIIKEINEKYQALELEIDTKLDAVKREENKFQKNNAICIEKAQQAREPKMLSYEEAMSRNANLLKSLEMAKARLRSRSTFSPVEQILDKALANYKMDLQMSHQFANEQRRKAESIYDTVEEQNCM